MVQRRRGAALDTAILRAAWDELTARGYSGFTVDGVVKRAATSPPVVYRRYADRGELIRAAIGYGVDDSSLVAMPDTGSLRGDLLSLMQAINEDGVQRITVMSIRLADFYSATGEPPGALFAKLRERARDDLTLIFDRAADRGEIDRHVVTDRIMALPFDLLRQEILLSYAAVADGVITEILDTIMLPLVGAARYPSSAFSNSAS